MENNPQDTSARVQQGVDALNPSQQPESTLTENEVNLFQDGEFVSSGFTSDGDNPISTRRLAFDRNNPDEAGKSIDTWETYHGEEWLAQPATQKKLAKQRKALARVMGVDEGEVTNQHVFNMGEQAKVSLREFLTTEDGINQVNLEGETFSSSLEGDNRQLGQAFLNSKGEDARDFMNTEMWNANFHSRHNERGRFEVENGSTRLEKGKSITDADALGKGGLLQNALLSLRDGASNLLTDAGDGISNAIGAVAGELKAGKADITQEDRETFGKIEGMRQQALKEARLEQSKSQKIEAAKDEAIASLYGDEAPENTRVTFDHELINKRADDILRARLGEEEIKFLDGLGKGTKTRQDLLKLRETKERAGVDTSNLKPVSKAVEDDRFKTLETERDTRLKLNNVFRVTSEISGLSNSVGSAPTDLKTTDKLNPVTGRNKAVSSASTIRQDRADQDADVRESATKVKEHFKNKDYGKGVVEALKGAGIQSIKHPGASIENAANSFAPMAALIVAPKLAIAQVTNSAYEDGVEGFQNSHSRLPDEKEQTIILATSVAKGLVNRFGAEAALGSLGSKASKAIVSGLTDKLGMSVGVATTIAVGSLVEGGEEVLESVLEQYAANQGTDKVFDGDALIKAFNAGVGSGGVLKTIMASPQVPQGIKNDLARVGKKVVPVLDSALTKGANVVAKSFGLDKATTAAQRKKVAEKVVASAASSQGTTVEDFQSVAPPLTPEETHSFTDQIEGNTPTVAPADIEVDPVDTETAFNNMYAIQESDLETTEGLAKSRDIMATAELAMQRELANVDNLTEPQIDALIERQGHLETVSAAINAKATPTLSDNETISSTKDLGTVLTHGSAAVANIDTSGLTADVASLVTELASFDSLMDIAIQNEGKNGKVVRGEKLGSRTNEAGKGGLGQHLSNLGAAIANDNLDTARNALGSIVNFRDQQNAKLTAIRNGLEQFKKTGSDVTVNYGRNGEFIISGPKGDAVPRTEAFIKDLEFENNLLEKAAKLGANLGEAHFSPETYSARRFEDDKARIDEEKVTNKQASEKPATVSNSTNTQVEEAGTESSEASDSTGADSTGQLSTQFDPIVRDKPEVAKPSKVQKTEANKLIQSVEATGLPLTKSEATESVKTTPVRDAIVNWSAKVKQRASKIDTVSSKALRPLRDMIAPRRKPENTAGIISNSTDLFNDIKSMSDDVFTEAEWEAVKQVEQFAIEMGSALDAVMPSVKNKGKGVQPALKGDGHVVFRELANRSPIFQFVNEQGILSPEVKNAIAVAALEWTQVSGSKTMYQTPEDVYSFFGIDPKANTLNEGTLQTMAVLGSHVTPEAASIGKQVLVNLNLKQSDNPDLDGLWQARLEQSIGDLALVAMSNMTTTPQDGSVGESRGYVEFNSIPVSTLSVISGQLLKVDGEVDVNATANFVRLPQQVGEGGFPLVDSKGNPELSDSLTKLRDFTNSIEYKKVMKAITGTNRAEGGVTAVPKRTAPEYITGTSSKLSPLYSDYIKSLNAQVMQKNPLWDLMKSFGDSPQDWLRMHGWTEPTIVNGEVTFPDLHGAHAISANGKNIGLEREYAQMLQHDVNYEAGKQEVEQEIADTVEALVIQLSNKGDTTKLDQHLARLERELEAYNDGDIYLEYHLISTGRANDKSKTLSIQRSKMHRNALSFRDHVETVDITNPDHVNAVVSGLIEPLKLDEGLFADNGIQEFTEKFMDKNGNAKDPVIRAGVEAMTKHLNGEGDVDKKAIADAVVNLKEGAHSLNALMVVASWSSAIKNGDTEFISYGYTEVDGTTNGVAAAMRQLVGGYDPAEIGVAGSKTEKIRDILNASGHIFNDQNFEEGIDYLKENPDAYQNIGILSSKILDPVSLRVRTANVDTLRNAVNDNIERRKAVRKRPFLEQKQAQDALDAAYLNYGVKVFEKTLPNFELVNGKVTDDVRKMMKAVVMPGGYQAGNTALANSLFNNWLGIQYTNMANGELESINDTLTKAGLDAVDVDNTKQVFPPKTLNTLQRIFVKSLGRNITNAYRESMGDFNENAAAINAAYGVMSIVATEVTQRSFDRLEAAKGSPLTNAEKDVERKRLQEEEGVFVGYKQFGATSDADSIAIVKEEKREVSADRGGYVSSGYSDGVIKTNKYDINSSGILTAERGVQTSSRTSRIKETVPSSDIGVAGFITTNIGIDSVTQAESLRKGSAVRGNMYDANLTGMLDASKEAVVTNQVWDGIHDSWSMWDAVSNQLEHLVSKHGEIAIQELNTYFKAYEKDFQGIETGNKFAPTITNEDGSRENFAGIRDFMNYFRERQTEGNTQRELVNSEITGVAQHRILGGTYNKDSSEVRGSSSNRVDITSFEEAMRAKATPERVSNLFYGYLDKGNISDSPNHKDRLISLMDNHILPLVRSSADYTISVDNSATANDVTGGAAQGQDIYIRSSDDAIRRFSTDMSDAEVLTHEFLHPIVEAGLQDNTKSIRELRKLQQQAIDSSTFTPDSLVDPTDVNQAEAKAKAERMYEYVTGSIHEFMVFGLSNDRVRSALESELVTPNEPETFIDRMIETLKDFIKNLTGQSIGRANDTNISASLDTLLNGFDTTTRVHLARQVSGLVNNQYVDAGRGFLADKVAAPIVAWGKTAAYKVPLSKEGGLRSPQEIALSLAKTPVRIFDVGFQKEGKKIAQVITGHKQNFISKLVRETLGTTAIDRPYHTLLSQVNEHVDSASLRISHEVKQAVEGSFSRKLLPSEQKLIADTVLRGDLKVFDHKSTHDIDALATLVSDTTVLDGRIRSALQSLQSTDKSWINNQAKSLGSVMAQGRALIEDGNLNAFNIATGVGYNGRGVVEQDTQKIDELKSLYAIKFMDVEARNEISKLLREEAQGFSTVMQIDKVNHDDTLLNTYNGDRSRVVAGEVISKSTNRSSTQILNLADHDKHLAAGYTQVKTLGSALGLYTKADVPSEGYQKGIFSMGNAELEGTVVKRQDRIGNELLLPIVSGGRIVGYRAILDKATREVDAGMSIGATESLGNHAGRVHRLAKGGDFNNRIVDLAKADFQANGLKERNAFIRVSTDSTNAQIREFARLMPREMRTRIQEEWNGDMFLRKNQLDLLLGYRKLSLVDAYNRRRVTQGEQEMNAVMGNAIRLAGDVWQGAISEVKRRTVLFTPAVVLANGISNLAVSVMHGMNPVDVVRDQREGLAAIRDYTRWQTELAALDLQIKLGNDVQRNKRERNRVEELLKSSGVHEMVQAGMFQTIVEDIDTSAGEASSPLNNVLQQALPEGVTAPIANAYRQAPDSVKRGIGILMLSPSTEFGANVQAATAYSDFMARYAMMKHLQKKGVSQEKAMAEVMDIYVDYAPNTSRELQYINDSGLYMYTKFFLRIQRVIMRAFRNHPEAALAMEASQQALGNISDITDSSLLWGVSMAGGRTQTPDEVLETLTQLPLFHMIGGLKDVM